MYDDRHNPLAGIEEELNGFSEENEDLEIKPFYTCEELLNRNIQNIPCLLDPIFPKVGLCAVAGSSDTGKSSWLRQLALFVAAGKSQFLGFKLNTETKKAIYVCTEDDQYAMSWLLNTANKTFNLSPAKFKEIKFIFDTYNLLERLDLMLSESKVDLIVIDAFSDIYGRSMNDTNQVRTFLNNIVS